MRAFATLEKTAEHNSTYLVTRGRIGEAPDHTPTSQLLADFFIYRKASCACGGGCRRCEGLIQPKLKISQPNDIYEQEADRVADEVMRMPDPAIQSKPT